ncbi:hypothetical protein [Escherichia coli]|uniref:hypothetical protein n=1 Tax=Escherichia coli TaxID=562 RepID=UPI0013D7DAEC
MKSAFGVIIVLISLASMVGVVEVFIGIDETVSSFNNSSSTDTGVIYGHRVGPDGKLILLTNR